MRRLHDRGRRLIRASAFGSHARTVARRLRGTPQRTLALLVAVGAGIAVFLIAHRVFPHHSTNHDEAVYLQQAAMLLEGQLFLQPPVPEVFRPWFFLSEGGRLAPKYAPVPAAIFALGALAGDPRLALAVTAAVAVALVYGIGSELFDRRTGLLGAVVLALSPQFLIDAAVFLPYVPTFALECGFAYAYLRADRTDALRPAAIAGLAIGAAFFARPFTAVLFATPFVAHAAWRIGWRERSGPAARSRGDANGLLSRLHRGVLRRNLVIAAGGLLGVVVTLGYNWLVTGSPLLFPYEAFAPRDGLGFGRRAILGYERTYTPALALRSNAIALRLFATEWVALGTAGASLAVVGGLATARRTLYRVGTAAIRARRVILLALVATVVVGNLFFWGTLNTLGALDRSGDGLVHFLGPYYHLDLFLPVSVFAAHGLRVLGDGASDVAGRVRPTDARSRRIPWRAIGAALLLLTGAVGGAVAVDRIDDRLDPNRAVASQLDAAYAPFDGWGRDRTGAIREPPDGVPRVVFLPTPQGDWLNHPFQRLRNDPGFDGSAVYAIDRDPFAVVDAYPDRRYLRYAYRGRWAPFRGTAVASRLQPVNHVRGERIVVNVTLGVPSGTDALSLRLAAGDETVYATVSPDAIRPGDRRSLQTVIVDGSARLEGPVVFPNRSGATVQSVQLDDVETVTLTAFVRRGRGTGGFSYRVELPVQAPGAPTTTTDRSARVLTPRTEVCHVAQLCDGEQASVPRRSADGVAIEVSLRATGDRSSAGR